MKRISKWLKSKFSPYSVEADEDHAPLGIGAGEKFREEISVSEFVNTLRIRTSPKESSYIIEDSSSYIVEESRAVDPYDTGSFQISKERSHK